jgi:flavin reductase (DIM6/NTAB) family NADH-FMN oxidoreductase RutF
MTAVASALTPDALRRAFAAFPSGVVAVTAEVEGEPVGLAASSFTSVSLDPPLISVSIARSSTTWPVLRAAARIGVSVLAHHHADTCRQLAGPSATRFDGLALRREATGALLLDDAAGAFDCAIEQEIEAGDHVIVLLRLHALQVSTTAPLVFHGSRLVPLPVRGTSDDS